MKEKTLLTIAKIILTPFIILSLWATLKVGKDIMTKEKKVKKIGITISK